MIRVFAFADEARPDLDGQIAAMLRNGLQGLEIRNVEGRNVSGLSPAQAREIRRRLDGAGLAVWAVGSPIGKISIRQDNFAAHLELLRHTLEIADILGCANLRGFSFYIPAGEDPALFRDEVLDRVGRMAELCQGAGVSFCHENEKGIYGDTAARCLQLFRGVPCLAGVFDPANFVQCGQDTLAAWDVLKPWIRYMHVKDALAGGRVVPAGRGAGHVGRILSEYLAGGGRCLTVEPHLRVFDGLSALEREDGRSGVDDAYPTGDAAFDAACLALRELLKGEDIA